MAISSNNSSLLGVQAILQQSAYAINAFETQAFAAQSREEIIKNDIRALKNQEEELLKYFGGRQGLQKRINQFKKDADNFRGKKVGLTFTWGYESVAKEDIRQLQKDFQTYVIQYLYSELGTGISTLTTADLAKVLNLQDIGIDDFDVIMNISKGTVTTKRRSGGQIGYKKEIKNIPISQVMVNKLSKPAQKRIRDDLIPQLKAKYQLKGNFNPNFIAQNNTLLVNPGAEWAKLISDSGKPMTKAEAMEKFKGKNGELTKINDKIIAQIKSGLGIDTYSGVFDAVIGQMIIQEPYMFFVGGNEKAVTGLIGEICAMILFYDLIGTFPDVDWAAQNTGLSGTQDSADIIIKKGFGIQVKNSTQELSTYKRFDDQLKIGFSEVGFDRLGESLGFNGNIIQDLYDTVYYNVSYTWGKSYKGSHAGTFRPGGNDTFDSTEVELEVLKERFENIMTTYAAALLYMQDARQTGIDFTSQGQGNVLYMVNLVPYYASDMLQEILNRLEQGTTSPLSFSTAKSDLNKKIYDDLNANPQNVFTRTGTFSTKTKFKTSYTF